MATTPIPRQVKLLALFLLAGGPIGGLVLWTAMLAVFVVKSVAGAIPLPEATMFQFFVFAPIAALFGIVLGAPSALPTGLLYTFGPEPLRQPWLITAIGASLGALSVGALFYSQPDVMRPDPYVEYCSMLALAGGVATLACLRLAHRWKLTPS